MKRRRLVLYGALALAIALMVRVWLLWPRPGITETNAARIQQGMTLAEVEAILGKSNVPRITTSILFPWIPPGHVDRRWRSERVLIDITFNEEGRVTGEIECRLRYPTVSTMIKRWLGLW